MITRIYIGTVVNVYEYKGALVYDEITSNHGGKNLLLNVERE